jgi:hypothetical protein
VRWAGGWVGGWVGERAGGWMGGRAGGRADGWVVRFVSCSWVDGVLRGSG